MCGMFHKFVYGIYQHSLILMMLSCFSAGIIVKKCNLFLTFFSLWKYFTESQYGGDEVVMMQCTSDGVQMLRM